MPGRRPLAALVALFVVPLPACLHVGAPRETTKQFQEPPKPVTKEVAKATEPAPPRIEFASLPRVPGTVVRVNTPGNPGAQVSAAPGPKANTPPKPVDPLRHLGGGEPAPFPLQPASTPVEPPLLAAVRAYCEGNPGRAIEIIRALDKPNQDICLALLPILARAVSADLNDPATAAVLVDQLHGAAAHLEPHAALRIQKVAFCKEVEGFGRFTPWPENQPYRPNARAQFYFEVRNLGSQPEGDGFATHVHAAVEVRDAHGKLVEQIAPKDWRHRVPVVRFEKRLVSRSPLSDFHVVYEFSVPAAPGVYSVSVELRDSTGRRAVKTPPAQFCVAGP